MIGLEGGWGLPFHCEEALDCEAGDQGDPGVSLSVPSAQL